MSSSVPIFLLSLALAAAMLSVFGDESYPQMRSLHSGLTVQQARNRMLGQEVQLLKREVYRLQRSDREIEKAARRQLGMMRDEEVLLIFERQGGATRGN